MNADPRTEQEISRAIDRFAAACAGRDMDVVLAGFAPDGDWLVVHGHFSMPAAGQEEGQSF